jgi:hypothetical protein
MKTLKCGRRLSVENLIEKESLKFKEFEHPAQIEAER